MATAWFRWGVALTLLAVSACGGGGDEADPVARGRAAYLANCVACHATNPKLAGPIGPEVAGSSRELIAAKVMRNTYPPGYAPKRATRAMAPLPHLEPKLEDLASYLGGLSPASIP